MAKRTASRSTATALDTLKSSVAVSDDAAAQLSQARKLEIMQSINKPEYRTDVPASLCYTDYGFNPRERSSYGIDANADLYDSLKTYGIDPTKPPITLAEEADGRFLTLRGNIRLSIIREMNNEAEKAGLPLPFPVIPALVYKGLTYDEKVLVMADHTGQRSLNRYELACMVGRASLARNWTDKEGATYFGLGASTVQRLRQIYMMPPVLEDLRKEVHYNPKKMADTPESEKPLVFTQKEVATLHSAYLNDVNIGFEKRDCSGPNFTAAMAGVMEARNGIDKTPITKRKPTELASVVSTYIENPNEAVSDAAKLVNWAKGDESETAYSIMARIKAKSDAQIREISDLKNEVTTLKADKAELILANRRLEQDNARLLNMVRELEADNSALASMIPMPSVPDASVPDASVPDASVPDAS